MSDRNITHLTRLEYDGLYERDPNTFYMIDEEAEEDEEDDFHIYVETNGYTEISFKNWDGSAVVENVHIEWKIRDNDWQLFQAFIPSLILPFAGSYKIRFVDKQYKCVFGGGHPEHAARFTKIDFGEGYIISDYSNMFRDCVSLVQLPTLMTDALVVFQNSPELSASPIARMARWSNNLTYELGDIVINEDIVYVSIRPSHSAVPNLSASSWLRLSEVNIKEPIEELPQKVKENIAGISNGDIPE